LIVFHHNVNGSNGKTKLFELARYTFGDLFMKCQSTALNPATITSPSAPNEELMSMRGRRVVMVAEPSVHLKLSASAIKEITGGDEQSTRANYKKKQTFVVNGMLHVLCNTIPETDEMVGGAERRFRIFPYLSLFVMDPAKVDEARHVFLGDTSVHLKFPKWRVHMMREVMAAAAARVERIRAGLPLDDPPELVIADTKELIERESKTKRFVSEWMVKTGAARDIVSLKDVHDAYKEFCKSEEVLPDKKKFFKPSIVASLGPMMTKSNGHSNIWRGWQIRMPLDAAGSAEPEPDPLGD
jgi:phage/plasmid-associated DNA primase